MPLEKTPVKFNQHVFQTHSTMVALQAFLYHDYRPCPSLQCCLPTQDWSNIISQVYHSGDTCLWNLQMNT